MHRYSKLLILFFSLHWLISIGYAEDVLRINALRYWSTPDQSRITFEVNTSASQNKVQFLENPARLVIDLPNAVVLKELAQPSASHPLFANIRVGAKNGTDLRIVLDLKKPLSNKTTTLHTDSLGTNRFVVELLDKGLSNQSLAKIEAKPNSKSIPLLLANIEKNLPKSQQNLPLAKTAVSEIQKTEIIAQKGVEKLIPVQHSDLIKTKTVKPFTVAIDAGHGGNDSGAQGKNGTYEKDVVFSIAKRLEMMINAQTGMKAVMIRQGDYYVGLRKRMDIARTAKADVFISIHADSIKDTEARGASVYALSTSGASSESAYWIAHSENSVEFVEGEQLHDEDNSLKNVLLDLSQSATQEASVLLANKVLHNFETVSQLHFDAVQKAGFAVLKSPDIPSILVETAFISNPAEELKLLNTGHQLKIASAILKGIHSFMKQPKNEQQRLAAL